MLKTVGAAALKDIIGMLKQEKNFFEADASTRKVVLDKHLPDFPEGFVTYLSDVTENQFMKDMSASVRLMTERVHVDQNGFLKALAAYLSIDLGLAVDQLDSEFFFMDYSARLSKLKSLFPGDFALSLVMRHMVAEATYQEVSHMANQALSTISAVPVIVIQTPIAIDPAQRQAMRQAFLEKYTHSFPEFQINPQIIGGMRVFVNGMVEDHSWLAKVQALTRLKI